MLVEHFWFCSPDHEVLHFVHSCCKNIVSRAYNHVAPIHQSISKKKSSTVAAKAIINTGT